MYLINLSIIWSFKRHLQTFYQASEHGACARIERVTTKRRDDNNCDNNSVFHVLRPYYICHGLDVCFLF